jgi:hypothetical protein
MPIEVQHQPSFALVGTAAQAAGYGQYAQEQAARAQAQANFESQNRRALLGMQMDQQARQQALAMSAYNQQAGRQHEMQMFAARDQQMAGRDAQMFDQQQQMAMQNDERAKELWDFQWTAKQKSQIAELNNYEQAVRASPNLSPQEKEMALLELQGQRAGFRPMAIPKQKQTTVQEMIDGGGVGLYTHPQTGQQVPVTLDRSGAMNFQDIPESAEMKMRADQVKSDMAAKQAKIKMVQQAITALTSEVPSADGLGGTKKVMPSQQQIAEYIRMVDAVTAASSMSVDAMQGSGMQPNQEWQQWQSGMQGPQQPQPQMGPQPQQPIQQQPQPPQVIQLPSGKTASMKAIEEAAAKLGIPVEQLIAQMQRQ